MRQDPRTGEDKVENATLLVLEPRPVLRIGDRIEVNYPGRIVLPATADMPMPGSAQLDFGLESTLAGTPRPDPCNTSCPACAGRRITRRSTTKPRTS